MAQPILMPALSPTMIEGKLVKWHKKVGDRIKPGEVLAEIETDKATMEVEAVDSGTLGKIIVDAPKGGIKVNELIAILLETGDDEKAMDAIIAEHPVPTTSPSEAKADNKPIQPTIQQPITIQPAIVQGRVFASPLAKRIAGQEGISLANITGSGPSGRIVKKDILAALDNRLVGAPLGRNPVEFTIKPISMMRQTIAKRLLESKQQAPHFYLSVDCELDALENLRNELNMRAPLKDGKPGYKISVNDFIIKACAAALNNYPAANASWTDEGILEYNNVDIAVAVAIPDGLITPIIRNANQKSWLAISAEMKSLVLKAKGGLLQPSEYQGGGFTISNLGMYGIKQFNAIINQPQACILAVGSAQKRPVVKNNQVVPATVMTLTISCDHRVVDGAAAAELLSEIKIMLENPAMMLI